MKLHQPLSSLTLSNVAGFLVHPRLSGVRLTRPNAPSATEAVHQLLPQFSIEEIDQTRLAFLTNAAFFNELNARTVARRHHYFLPDRWFELMYLLVRFIQPEVMVETGVFDGVSSALILLAMSENQKGRLVSIDLPRPDEAVATHAPTDSYGPISAADAGTLPHGCDPGWIIPDSLRDRHALHLGDAKVLLPKLLGDLGKIDIFFHDSNHSYAHMRWEFQNAWPAIKEGGWLFSDDIYWNLAWTEFAKSHDKPFVHFRSMGVLRK